MADFVFNIAKGRVAELYNRVDQGDPSTARLTIVAIDANGETDATLKDFDTLSALLAGTANEPTNTNYARKTIAAADIAAMTPDDTNDWMPLDITADPTWTAVAATGGAGPWTWTDLVICYNPTAGADTTLVPLTCHDFVVTPDGSDITAVLNATGFYKAT